MLTGWKGTEFIINIKDIKHIRGYKDLEKLGARSHVFTSMSTNEQTNCEFYCQETPKEILAMINKVQPTDKKSYLELD